MTIGPENLFQLYLEVLDAACIASSAEKQEDIDYFLYEVFDIGVISFFHEEALNKLLSSGFIDGKQVERSIEIRAEWNRLGLLDELQSASIENRCYQPWVDFFASCVHLRESISRKWGSVKRTV